MARIKKYSNFLMWLFLPSLLLVISVFGVNLLSKPTAAGLPGLPGCSLVSDCTSFDPNPCRQFDCVNSFCSITGLDTSNPACIACGTCGNGICEPSLGESGSCDGGGQDCNGAPIAAGCPSTQFLNGCSGSTRDFCCSTPCVGDSANSLFDIDCGCCGDSLTGTGEQCDPSGSTCTVPGGPTDGGTCNAICQCAGNCGNGTVDAGEACDPQASPTGCVAPQTCNPTTCQCDGGAVCGDGTVDPGEECDGPTCNFVASDGAVIPGVCELCICIPECQTEGSGCGDDGTDLPAVCFSGTGGGGSSLIPMGVRAGTLAQWLAVFAIPGAAFVGLKVRRRFKK